MIKIGRQTKPKTNAEETEEMENAEDPVATMGIFSPPSRGSAAGGAGDRHPRGHPLEPPLSSLQGHTFLGCS